MIHPLIINSNGKIEIRKNNSFNISLLRNLKKTIDSWKLQPQRILMSEQDYNDLLEYSKFGA
jgi:hypothetical protein